MLFPIQWNVPFGLVMVEAMACGTPVLAMPGGSVSEVVQEGVSGHICRTVRSMAKRLHNLSFDSAAIRSYVEQNFSLDTWWRNTCPSTKKPQTSEVSNADPHALAIVNSDNSSNQHSPLSRP